jgi:hypothetical protein
MVIAPLFVSYIPLKNLSIASDLSA